MCWNMKLLLLLLAVVVSSLPLLHTIINGLLLKSSYVSTTLLSIKLHCCNLDDLNSSSDAQFAQSISKAFEDLCKVPNFNCYQRHFYISQLFQLSCKIQLFVHLFGFYYFQSGAERAKSTRKKKFLFFFIIDTNLSLLTWIWRSIYISKETNFISKFQRILCLFFVGQILICVYTIY